MVSFTFGNHIPESKEGFLSANFILDKTVNFMTSKQIPEWHKGASNNSLLPWLVHRFTPDSVIFLKKIITFPQKAPSHDIGAHPQCTHTGFGHRKLTKRPILYTKFRSPIQNDARSGKTLKHATLSCTEASVTT